MASKKSSRPSDSKRGGEPPADPPPTGDSPQIPIERRSGRDRRDGENKGRRASDRAAESPPDTPERRKGDRRQSEMPPPAKDASVGGSALRRRKGAGIRRSDERRSAEEGEMTDEQFDFLAAVTEFRKVNQIAFPTHTDILAILKYLGYRKVAPVGEIDIDGFDTTASNEAENNGEADEDAEV